uniref:Glutaredoxin domain-containing protein n=1 Tax=viral metagenome TaxID=1070528 RepID=A0A6C0F7X7_9ZZZZ
MDYTAYISPKCDFCNQFMSIVSEKQLTNINVVDVHKKQTPQGIHSVPTIIDSQGRMYIGKQCFNIINSLQESPISGVDSTNSFSFIDNERMTNQNNFSFIQEMTQGQQRQQETSRTDFMDKLIEKRNNEVPQPITRR